MTASVHLNQINELKTMFAKLKGSIDKGDKDKDDKEKKSSKKDRGDKGEKKSSKKDRSDKGEKKSSKKDKKDKDKSNKRQDSNGSTKQSTSSRSTASSGGAGAMSVTSNMATFRVQIPPHVKPGEEFQVYAGSRVVKVRAPANAKPGTSLQITVPVDPAADKEREKLANSMSDAAPDSENVTKIPNQQLAEGEMPAYMVRIPEGVRPGTQFPVTIGGQQLMITCPNMARPGNSVRITPPPSSKEKQRRQPKRMVNPNRQNDKTQMFEVVVPKGVNPGHPFALMAGGVRVLVTCPSNAAPGQKIRFHLPIALVNRQEGPKSKLAQIKLSYDKDGWSRTIRATDMKFQWTRFDADGGVDTRTRFDTDRSAYVLKLDFTNDDDRMRTGKVSLVTPEKSVVDSCIKGNNGEDIVTFTDIAAAQNKSYEEKIQWFQDTCAQLCVEWNEGHMRMNVRRDYLLSDSMAAVMSLSANDLRKVWRFEFIGEQGIDAGGLAREWFQLVTNECFDPAMGLWQPCATNQMCLQINPASEFLCEDHLYYFRFIGRIMGKAMFDRQIVNGHMVKYLYKHILSWPIMFNDLKDLDEEYYNSLKGLKDMGADVEYVGVDFTVTEETLGVKSTVELIPDGANIDVTEENLPEYVEACLKYRMLGRCEKQINELLLGFFDVIPEPLLTIFDFQELELLMCGMPDIDMEDWIENTEYSGEYDREGPNHQTCVWFWEVVSEYDHEMKARLLQFVTGEYI